MSGRIGQDFLGCTQVAGLSMVGTKVGAVAELLGPSRTRLAVSCANAVLLCVFWSSTCLREAS